MRYLTEDGQGRDSELDDKEEGREEEESDDARAFPKRGIPTGHSISAIEISARRRSA